MPNRYLEAARIARERELHYERLHAIERRKPRVVESVPKSAPRTANPAVALEAAFEQTHHAVKIADINAGLARQRARQLDHALTAGRASLGTKTARQRLQAEVAQEDRQHRRRLKNMQPRLASPSAIALLTGKPTGPAKAATIEDDDADE